MVKTTWEIFNILRTHKEIKIKDFKKKKIQNFQWHRTTFWYTARQDLEISFIFLKKYIDNINQ